MSRHRLEDLGRVLMILQRIDEDIDFEFTGRRKDFPEWFLSLDEEKKSDFLYELPYKMERIEERIAECILICRGHDELNQDTNE